MATNVTFNGSTFSIPAEGDSNWGTALSNYFIAIGSGALQKTGGSFTLLAETDFGSGFGLKSLYFRSRATNPSGAGIVRLGNAEAVSWRNAANSGDLPLAVNSSNQLQFNGVTLLASGLIVNADVAPSAAIAYSKLNLSSSIINTDISDTAAIAFSKMAPLTASRALVSGGGGVIEATSVTTTEIGYLFGVTSGIQMQIDSKAATSATVLKSAFIAKGDILVSTGSGAPTAVPVGANGTVFTADSSEPSGAKWAAPAASPVTTKGDLVGYDTAPTRIPVGSNGKILTADSSAAVGVAYKTATITNLIGSVFWHGSAAAPTGALLANGAAVSRTTYAALFAVIGTTFGVGDGSTTFNLPNGQGVSPRGTGSQTVNGRTKTGPALGAVEEDQFQGHRHSIRVPASAGGATLWGFELWSGSRSTTLSNSAAAGEDAIGNATTDGVNGTPRTGSETRVNAIGLTACIWALPIELTLT